MVNERIIKVDAIELCTESFGDSEHPAILLIAGATVSMLFWDASFCQKLADQGFFVIRYDNRDVGRSTCYDVGMTPYDLNDLTDDAMAILEGYQIQVAHVVGMSLGGIIAQIGVIKYPQKIKSLTLMSSIPWGDSDPTIPEMDARILNFHRKAGDVDWENEEQVVSYLMEGAALVSGKKSWDKQRSERLIRAEFNRARNYVSMFNHASIQGGEEYYNRIDEFVHPTLIIHGTEDLICHFKHALILNEKINQSKLIRLEGTGHELHNEDWDIIINGITRQINEVTSSRG